MAITDSPVHEDQVYLQELPGFLGDIPCSLLRLDLLHPQVSGNKWYKLKHNIAAAKQAAKHTLLSFGGAWSNHLLALGAAADHAGMKSVGMVRGLHAAAQLTPLLQQCRDYGMELHFLEREQYAQKTAPVFLQQLAAMYPDAYFIPEGGANAAGRSGAGEIAAFIPAGFTHITLSIGTGTTFAGLRHTLPAEQHMLGFAPMKGGAYLEAEIRTFLEPDKDQNWSLTDAWHFGGFGKSNTGLLDFMQSFRAQYGTGLDRVYTAKMLYGLRSMAADGAIPPQARVLAIHTGGLCGNENAGQD